jgi:hypothetical protein
MAITITDEPISIPAPTPVSDCLRWCLQPDSADVLDTPGSFAVISVIFPGTIGSIPANGTAFTIFGHTFTVDNTVANTSTSFRIVASGNTTGTNFRNMLRANFFFSVATVAADGALTNTLITWNTCGEQENFTGVNMDLQTLIDAGATVLVTNGVTAVPVSGAMVQVRLMKADNDTGVFSPITKYEGFTPDISCDTVGGLCIDYMQDARRTLFTPMPDLSLTSEISPDLTTMLGQFYIEFGTTYRDVNCQAQSGVFGQSDTVYVMDTVFELQENYGMRRYIYDHPDNLCMGCSPPPLSPQFLTNKPSRLILGENSFAWLWLAAGYQSISPAVINLRFNIFYKNGTTGFVLVPYDPLQSYQVHCFNVSPGRLLSLFSLTDLSTVSHYFVRAEADSETIGWDSYFGIEQACEGLVDVYFKTPPGGIGTILCEMASTDVVQEGTEICLNTPCSTSRLEKGKYSGRLLNQIRSYEKVTLKARRNFADDEVAYFRSLKASPERWIQIAETGEPGHYMAKKLIVDTGGVKIMQSGEYIDLIIEGTLQDIPIQSGLKSS